MRDKKYGHLTLVFDRERGLNFYDSLEPDEKFVESLILSVSFNGVLPTGRITPDGTVRAQTFAQWCDVNDCIFTEWHKNCAIIYARFPATGKPTDDAISRTAFLIDLDVRMRTAFNNLNDIRVENRCYAVHCSLDDDSEYSYPLKDYVQAVYPV